jgi:hypothetical protein
MNVQTLRERESELLDSSSPTDTVPLQANLASRGSDVALAVVDASLVYGPYFSLARLLQLAQVRAKDIVAFTEITPQTLACQDCHPVFLSSPLGPCPRMSLSSGGEHQHHTAPLYVLTPESAATLASGGGQVDPAALLATQQAFGSHVPQVWLAEGWAQEQANIRAKVMSHQHAAVKGLPERFRQAEWVYSMVKKEHPVYATSSHCFGSKKPSQHELPESWSGIKGGLAAFGSGKEKHSGLSTGIRMSKVHQSLDGWC